MEAKAECDSIENNESFAASEAKKSKRLATAGFVALTFVLLASVLYTPSQVDRNGQYFTICGFKALTGLPCPLRTDALVLCDWQGRPREARVQRSRTAAFPCLVLVWLRFLCWLV
jgi:hypothetical protein